jgi:hypothetical protein
MPRAGELASAHVTHSTVAKKFRSCRNADNQIGLAFRASASVRCTNQEREALQVTSDKKGRCRLHGGASGSGGPPGERNGQYRHGERTKTAIAERRKIQHFAENAPRWADVSKSIAPLA